MKIPNQSFGDLHKEMAANESPKILLSQFTSFMKKGNGTCIPNCICVTAEGCPCCTSIIWPDAFGRQKVFW